MEKTVKSGKTGLKKTLDHTDYRILQYLDAGHSQTELARIIGVKVSTINNRIHRPVFQAELNALKKSMVDAIHARRAEIMGALDTALTGKDKALALRAAKILLDKMLPDKHHAEIENTGAVNVVISPQFLPDNDPDAHPPRVLPGN